MLFLTLDMCYRLYILISALDIYISNVSNDESALCPESKSMAVSQSLVIFNISKIKVLWVTSQSKEWAKIVPIANKYRCVS